jgi:hypothetical protein
MCHAALFIMAHRPSSDRCGNARSYANGNADYHVFFFSHYFGAGGVSAGSGKNDWLNVRNRRSKISQRS